MFCYTPPLFFPDSANRFGPLLVSPSSIFLRFLEEEKNGVGIGNILSTCTFYCATTFPSKRRGKRGTGLPKSCLLSTVCGPWAQQFPRKGKLELDLGGFRQIQCLQDVRKQFLFLDLPSNICFSNEFFFCLARPCHHFICKLSGTPDLVF